MTSESFLTYYPWFSGLPATVLEDLTSRSSLRFSDLEEDAEEARRLWIAHKLTLYTQTFLPTGETAPSAQAIATAGDTYRETSKKVGDVSVTLASTVSTTNDLSDLTKTVYGLQLLTLLRQNTYTRYVP